MSDTPCTLTITNLSYEQAIALLNLIPETIDLTLTRQGATQEFRL